MNSELQEKVRSRRWRLNNLYRITDKNGRCITFTMNSAQEALYRQMHRQNVILKARQRGFITFIQLFMLDTCLFNDDIRAGTIAHTLPDARAIFRDKIRFPYDNLPDGLKHALPAQNDNATELLLYYIYEIGFRFWDSAYAAALTMVLLLLLGVVALLQFWFLERKVHYQ